MQHEDAVVVEQVADLAEELGIVLLADVLEHADRDDAVVLVAVLAVVAQVELHAVVAAGQLGALLAHIVLPGPGGYAGNLAVAGLLPGEAEAAPAGAEVDTLHAGRHAQKPHR